MNKHILIAFDDSLNAMRAVEFVGAHFTPDYHVTLFCVVPDTESICTMQSPELKAYFLEQQDLFCVLDDKKKQLLNTALKKARDCLISYGFDADRVIPKLNKLDKGVARDIIAEANKIAYDLLVLGKKGHSGLKDFFLGSISEKVLHGVHKSTVLLVD